MRRLLASSLGLGLILRRIRGSDTGAGTIGAALAIPLALAVTNTWLEVALRSGKRLSIKTGVLDG